MFNFIIKSISIVFLLSFVHSAQAADAGAVDILAIDASLLRSLDQTIRNFWESVSQKIETSKGDVIQVSQDHDSAQQLLGLGGAIALLRWKMD